LRRSLDPRSTHPV